MNIKMSDANVFPGDICQDFTWKRENGRIFSTCFSFRKINNGGKIRLSVFLRAFIGKAFTVLGFSPRKVKIFLSVTFILKCSLSAGGGIKRGLVKMAINYLEEVKGSGLFKAFIYEMTHRCSYSLARH